MKLKFALGLLLPIAAFGLVFSSLTRALPQQNISAGNMVTMTQGGNVAQVTAAGAQKVDGSAVTQPISGTLTANAGSGTFIVGDGSGPLTVDGSFSSAPLTGCGGTNYDSGIITLPSTSTVLTSTATCVTSITLINLTTSQQTCTVTDNQGTPANLMPPSYDIAPKSDVTFNRNGVKALSGIKWNCTNAGAVAGIIRGNQ